MAQERVRDEGTLSIHLREVHQALTIKMIATRSEDLVTCVAAESPSEVKTRVQELSGSQPEELRFDFLPVKADRKGPIVGFFQVDLAHSAEATMVRECQGFGPLTESDLIAAGTSILDFIRTADDTPKPRLVVGDQGIYGLVNSADLVHPAVGMAMAVRILEFETRMNERIAARFGTCDTWMERLDCGARRVINKLYQELRKRKIEPSFKWMCGSINYKMDILEVDPGSDSRTLIRDVRNAVFHTRPASEIRAALKVLEETEQLLCRPSEAAS